MQNRPTLNTQRLFGVALFLKVILASLGYWLELPFWLGFAAPMVVMVTYMVVGYHTRETDVSEDKFADSCYYLGFIFTIASIILCLLDIPKMSAGTGLRDIAVRFGAAMASTVLGIAVRVYLVSFRKDASDGMKDAEDALLESTRLFTAQLQENLRTLQSFEQQVIAAGRASVASVQTQVETLARNFSDTLSAFYAQLNKENREAFGEMVDEVKQASARLAVSVDGYSQGMQAHLGSIESKVGQFADAVNSRLATTTFPDDYFATRLKAPLDKLALEADGVGEAIRLVNDEVKTSATTLRSALTSVNNKMKTGVEVMSTVVQMADQQRMLLEASQQQAGIYARFIERLEQIEQALNETVRTATGTNNVSGEILIHLSGLAAESTALREGIHMSIAGVTSKLEENIRMTAELLAKIDGHAERVGQGSADIVQALKGHAEQVSSVNDHFGAVTSASHGLTRQLESVVASNATVLEDTRRRLESLDRASASSEKIVVRLAELHPLLSRQTDALQAATALRVGRAGRISNEQLPTPGSHLLTNALPIVSLRMPVVQPSEIGISLDRVGTEDAAPSDESHLVVPNA